MMQSAESVDADDGGHVGAVRVMMNDKANVSRIDIAHAVRLSD